MAIYEATDQDFRALTAEGVSLIDFYSTHCGPCRMLLPVLMQIESELPFINLIKVNTDTCTAVADEFRITSLPTLYLGKDGEYTEYTGRRSADDIREAIGGLLYT